MLHAFALWVLGSNATHCSPADFCTWWHDTGELNADTPVAPGNVRQSRHYRVSVAAAAGGAATYSPAFVHEAIPRNGNGRIFSPHDAPNSGTLPADVDDGVSIEPAIGLSMAWAQFEYRADVDVKITRIGGGSAAVGNLTIRPTSLGLVARPSADGDGSVLVRVPAVALLGAAAAAAAAPQQRALQFTVEFDDDLYEFCSDGSRYVPGPAGPTVAVVGVEPTHALLIFASPFLPPSALPPPSSSPNASVHTMVPGRPIRGGGGGGDLGDAEVLYFPAGVFWTGGDAHLTLHPNTRWVHFAPGAYVKAAIEYTSQASALLATGHGVLSGERYVYQANAAANYTALKSDRTSLRMWWHNSAGARGQPQQTWRVEGPTLHAPPFNSMDFNGPGLAPAVAMRDYAQVGAFFFQTDGPELYANSRVSDVFFHVNDDAVKAYHSNVTVARATVWKAHNDPVVQMGWSARAVAGVVIEGLSVVHTRYFKSEMGVPSAIFGASGFYAPGQEVQPGMAVALAASDVVCEGAHCPALLRITPLQSYRVRLSRVAFPGGLSGSLGLGVSRIPAASPRVTMGLEIVDWSVGTEAVTMENFQSDRLGQLDIDASYWGQWNITTSESY